MAPLIVSRRVDASPTTRAARSTVARPIRWHYDLLAGSVHFDERLSVLLGLPPMPVVTTGREFLTLVHPADRGMLREFHQSLISGGQRICQGVFTLRKPGGDVRIMGKGRVAMRDADGKPTRLAGTLAAAETAFKAAGAQPRRAKSTHQATPRSRRTQLEGELRRALSDEALSLHYQPRVDAQLQPQSVEALARWPHHERGLLSAEQFVPLAERRGLISALGAWVIRRACSEAKSWSQRAGVPLRLAVNLSAHELRDGAGFLRNLHASLEATQFDPSMLEFELTETALLRSSNIAVLHKIAALGIQLSIDDFGTGYSCLGYLKDLPVQTLKIDRSFVGESVSDRRQRAIVEAILALAHKLELRVIAEGIETAEQLALMRELGCREFQGYLFGRPVPAALLDNALAA